MKYYAAVKKDQDIIFVPLEKVLPESKETRQSCVQRVLSFVKKNHMLSYKNRNLEFPAFPQENRGGVGRA